MNYAEEIEYCLSHHLFRAALVSALIIPDVCGKYEYPNDSSKDRYTKWYDNFAKKYFTSKAISLPGNQIKDCTWMSANECYQIRCAVLHSGNFVTKRIDLNEINFHAHLGNGTITTHLVRDGVFADFDIVLFCQSMAMAFDAYCQINHSCHNDFININILD